MWPNVVETAARFYNTMDVRVREIRMNSNTFEELKRRIGLTPSPLGFTPPSLLNDIQGTIFGTPIVLDEKMVDTLWEARDWDGAVITSGRLT